MTWYTLEPTAATRDLWVWPRRVLPDGATAELDRDTGHLVHAGGPHVVDIPVRYEPPAGHDGKRVRDFVFSAASLGGFKLVSERLAEVLTDCGARLDVSPIDVRQRDGSPVLGLVGVLESIHDAAPLPVHSYWRGRRSDSFIVDDHVLQALRTARLGGLTLRRVDHPWPGDHTDLDDLHDLDAPVEWIDLR